MSVNPEGISSLLARREYGKAVPLLKLESAKYPSNVRIQLRSILSSGTEFVYQPWRHFNVSIGYRDINIEVSSTSEDWRGKAQGRHSGPVVLFGTTF